MAICNATTFFPRSTLCWEQRTWTSFDTKSRSSPGINANSA